MLEAFFVETAFRAGTGQDRVHLMVDTNATVGRSFAGRLREPMLLEIIPQHGFKLGGEILQSLNIEVFSAFEP